MRQFARRSETWRAIAQFPFQANGLRTLKPCAIAAVARGLEAVARCVELAERTVKSVA